MTERVIVEGESGTINVIENSATPTIIEVISQGPKGDAGESNFEITSQKIIDALGFTPLPNNYAPSWSSVSGKPNFANVALSGSYSDLSGRPTFSNVAFSGDYSDLTGTPSAYSLPTGSTTTLGGFKVDGTTIVAVAGVLSAVGGGGGSSVAVKDEGSVLTSAVSSIDFVGTGVTVTATGTVVTVTIPASTLATLGIPNVENKSAAQILSGLTAEQVTSSLGFAPLPDTYAPNWAQVTGKPVFAAVATSGLKADVGLSNVENKSSETIRSEITSANVTAALGFTPINVSSVGAASGITPLGADSKVPAIYLPSYVDDVLEFANLAAFPATGESGKIYIAISPNNLQYRWTGSAYAAITSSPGSTDAVPEGAANKYFTESRVLSTVLTGLSLASGAAVAAADTVLAAIGKLQKQITDLASTIGGKLNLSGGKLTGALDEAPAVTLASAATTSIGAAAGNTVNVTGTVTITSFGAGTEGTVRRVIFAGALTLTHNAASLILPLGANITTVAGDHAEFISLGGNNWRCMNFTRNSVTVPASGIALTSTAANLQNNNLLNIKTPAFTAQGAIGSTTGAITVDWSTGALKLQPEPTGNITYTFTNPVGISRCQLLIASDGSSPAVAFAFPASVKWFGAAWTPVANKAAVINFFFDGTTYWAMGSNQA